MKNSPKTPLNMQKNVKIGKLHALEMHMDFKDGENIWL